MKLTRDHIAALPDDQLQPLRDHELKLGADHEKAMKKHRGYASQLFDEIQRRERAKGQGA